MTIVIYFWPLQRLRETDTTDVVFSVIFPCSNTYSYDNPRIFHGIDLSHFSEIYVQIY
jgi:hypothetical protein